MDYSDDDEDMLYNYVYDESVFPDIGDFDHQHRLVGGRVSKPRAWLALMVIMQVTMTMMMMMMMMMMIMMMIIVIMQAGEGRKKQQYNCGGTLINSRKVGQFRSEESADSSRYILTAAHCLCPKSYHCRSVRIDLRKKRNVNVNVCVGVAQEKDCLVRH